MRSFYTDIIAEEDVQALLGLERRSKRHDFDVALKIPSFKCLMDCITEEIPEKPILGKPSYYRIERRPDAHALHFDGCQLGRMGTGYIPNHMSWCRYSAVSVLTNEWEGGTLRFYSPPLELGKNLYRSVVIYSSASDNDPQAHERDTVQGDRAALLIFLATEQT